MSAQNWKEQDKAMSEGYWKLWNSEVQARIDRDIEANRKADAVVKLPGAAAGTEAEVEQLSHAFVFGAHIFNFDQLGSDECNSKYRELFGTLFNSATIAFYWKQFEMEEGKPRFKGEFRDSAAFWEGSPDPKSEPHWRRPATDPVVAFCESKGIKLHGHTLAWGNRKWQLPEWLFREMPAHLWKKYSAASNDHSSFVDIFAKYTPAQIAEMLPELALKLNVEQARRITEIALRYKGRVNSWDVVNESATDFGKGVMIPGDAICKSWYGLMPGDYPYRAFKVAESVFPKEVKLNINDYNLGQCYVDEVKDLVERGCRVDRIGAQMHLFNPQTCLDIADGKSEEQSPESVWTAMNRISATGKPIHLSEITITAPNNDERGQAIQAVITRNLYRLWFSVKPMMGITWWNVVDDCGAPGEPSVSGLFSRDMKPKPAYFTLDKLTNELWKTKLELKAGKSGEIAFRGFRGKYRIAWKDAKGKKQTMAFDLDNGN